MPPPNRQKKVMTQPIALIFRMLQSNATVRVWLHGTSERRMEGRVIVRRCFRPGRAEWAVWGTDTGGPCCAGV